MPSTTVSRISFTSYRRHLSSQKAGRTLALAGRNADTEPKGHELPSCSAARDMMRHMLKTEVRARRLISYMYRTDVALTS